MFSREICITEDVSIDIDQIEEGDTGVVVWDAAIVLAKYLALKSGELNAKSILELGSGTGVVGLSAASLGANVLITDLEENLELMKHNIKKNEAHLIGKADASVLKWGDKEKIQNLKSERPTDFILVADCVYYKESLVDLVYTLRELSNPKTQVFVSYEDRDSEIKIQLQKDFMELMRRYFNVKEIPLEEQDPEFRSPDIHILKFQLKSDS